MKKIEEVEKKLGGTHDIMDSPETELSYATAQFVSLLRENGFDIPVSTTRQIVSAIYKVARDPRMHVKLLNEKWFKNILRSFIAKSEDESRLFDDKFQQALELGVKREDIKKRVFYNSAMKVFGDEMSQYVVRDFQNQFLSPATRDSNISSTIKGLMGFLAARGFDARDNKHIINLIAKNPAGRSIESGMRDILRKSMDEEVHSFNAALPIDDWLPVAIQIKARNLKFGTKDFNEQWMGKVIKNAYGIHNSPFFDAAIDEYLMKQRQETVESELGGDRMKEEGGLNPNFLLGAVNDYIVSLHGPVVPRVYDFPMRNVKISDKINKDAAADAAALVVGGISFKTIRNVTIPTSYKNLVERALYLRALKNHFRSSLSTIVDIAVDMTDDELEHLVFSFDSVRERIAGENVERTERTKGKDIKEFEDLYGDFDKFVVKAEDTNVELISKAKDDKERMVVNLTMFLEHAIKLKNYTWTFTEGENKGKTIIIENLKDYREFRKEYNEERKKSRSSVKDDVGAAIDDLMKDVTPVLTRKDIRDIEASTRQLPKDNRDAIKDIIGNFDKYHRDIGDKIDELIGTTSQSDRLKKSLKDAVKRTSMSMADLKKLGSIAEKHGNDALKEKIQKLIDQNASLGIDDASQLVNALDALDKNDASSIKDKLSDARISPSDAGKVRDAVESIPDTRSRDAARKVMDKNIFSKKDLDKLIDALRSTGDDSIASAVESAIGDMKFLKDRIDAIREMAQGTPSLLDAINDAFGDGNSTTMDKLESLKNAIESMNDPSAKKVKKALDDVPFLARGMNDLPGILESIADKKARSAVEKIVAKKFSVDDAADISALSSALSSVLDEKLKESARKALSGVEFPFKDIEDFSKALDDIAGKYDVKSLVDSLLAKKKIELDAKDVDDILELARGMSPKQSSEVEDAIDATRFTGDKEREILDILDKMKDDERVKSDIESIVDKIGGLTLSASKAKELRDAVKGTGATTKIDDMLSKGTAKGQSASANADILDKAADDMQQALDRDGGKLKVTDKEAWQASRDMIDFLRKRAEGLRRGTEDVSKVFGETESGTTLNAVMRRLAKTENAEQLAMDWMSSMYKMFNEFADRSSDEEKKALFAGIATKLDDGKKKLDKFTKDIELSTELKDRYDAANKHNRDIKEQFDFTVTEARKWFDEQGLDISQQLRDRISHVARTDQTGNRLIPPSDAARLDFGLHPRRHRFAAPEFTELPAVTEMGNEKAPWTLVNFLGDEAGDALVSKIEPFGNAVAKGGSEEEPPQGPGGFPAPPTDAPDDSYYQKLVEELEKTREEDVARQWARKIGDALGESLMPEIMQKMSGEGGGMPNPKDQLDIEADIDIPHPPSPFSESGGGGLTVESKPGLEGGKGGGKGGGAGGKGAQAGKPGGAGKGAAGATAGAAIKGARVGGKVGPGATAEAAEGEEEAPAGMPSYVDLDIRDMINSKIDDFERGKRDLDGAQYDGTGVIDPDEWFQPGKVLDNAKVAELVAQMVEKPQNAAMMRKKFRSSFRSAYSEIVRRKFGRQLIQVVDRTETIRRESRHGLNPRNDKIAIFRLHKKHGKNVKRDIFAVDVSGSMMSYLGVASQLIASLTDPAYLKVVLFDTDAVKIDESIFKKNPAVIFKDMNAFIMEAAAREGKTWQGTGKTSYDSAVGEMDKIKITKSDRVIIIGDLEHNTVLQQNAKMFDDWKKQGLCSPSLDEFNCVAKWINDVCQKADSCIVINPKVNIGDDLTCDLLAHNIPTCFAGALSGKGGSKATSNDNQVTGEGLLKTVECLKLGMTGMKPKVDASVMDFCEKKRTGKAGFSDTMDVSGVDLF